VTKKPDYSIYNQLYKFDVKQELQDYNQPFAHPDDEPALPTKQLAASKVSSFFEPSDEKSVGEDDSQEEQVAGKVNYTEIAKGLYRE
jgi:hypothetical protein